MIVETKRVEWPVFTRHYFNAETLEQGEHVTLLGPTKRGKSTLALRVILPIRANRGGYIVVFDAKGDDPTLLRNTKGYRVVRKWPPRGISDDNRLFRLVAPTQKMSQLSLAAKVFRPALESLYEDGHWTVYCDEARLMADHMHLRREMTAIWIMGNTRRVSMIAGSQAPRYVPTEMYDQPSHFFLWRNRDEKGLKRISEIGGDTHRIQQAVRTLDYHDFLYVDNVRDRMVISKLPLDG